MHDLRHGFATIALGRGVPLKVVSEGLGRSSAAFTADVFMHVDGTMAEAATQAVTDAVFDELQEWEHRNGNCKIR